MNKSIVRIVLLLAVVCTMPLSNADDLRIPFSRQFDSAVVRTVYGEADHSVSIRWTADSLSVSTDLYGGRTVSDFNATNRLYLLKALEGVYREKSVSSDDSCSRTWVEAYFYRGKDSIVRRACLFPAGFPVIGPP
jgi:hypothetical protein